MKLNKKGFTLVELLAVIVVLSIIALIGYTTIGDVITSSQDKADKTSIGEFAKALSNTVLMYRVDDTKGLENTRINALKNSDDINALKLRSTSGEATPKGSAANIYSGDKVTCTSISVTADGVVTLSGCYAGTRTSKTFSYSNGKVSS